MKKYLLSLAMVLISVNAVSEDLGEQILDMRQPTIYGTGPLEMASPLQSASPLENAGPLIAVNPIQEAAPLTTSLKINMAPLVYIIPEVPFQTTTIVDLTSSNFTPAKAKTIITSTETTTSIISDTVTKTIEISSIQSDLTLSYAPVVYSSTSQTSVSPN